jgi:membrane-associated phospholipid phosphatase
MDTSVAGLRKRLRGGIPPVVEVPYRERAPAPRWLLAVAVVAGLLTAISILTIDQPVARFLARYEPHAAWDHTLSALEWAIGLQLIPWTTGIVLVVAMIVTMAVPRWRHETAAWMFVAAVHVLSRIAMVQLKDLTGRLRPLEWLHKGGGETFGWVDGISWPSGHVVLFASLVIPALAVMPRRAPMWIRAALWALIAFVGLARIVASAHFISDVLGAVSLVALIAWLCGLAIRPRLVRA